MPKYSGKNYKRIGTSGKNETLLHRLVAEKALGHILPPNATIHHVRGGREGPIVICQDNAYHMLLHVRTRAFMATDNPYKKRCPICKKWDDPQNMYWARNQANGWYRHAECDNTYRRQLRERKG